MSATDQYFWLKVLEIFLISSVKFLFAPFEAERQGFNFLQSFLITTTGGLLGVLAFTYAGNFIFSFWVHLKAMIKSLFQKKSAREIEKKIPKKVNMEKPLIQWIRKKFGLPGIAFFTPCIISIPIGTLIAVSLYRSRIKIFLSTGLALIFWSLILNFIAQYLELSQYLSI